MMVRGDHLCMCKCENDRGHPERYKNFNENLLLSFRSVSHSLDPFRRRVSKSLKNVLKNLCLQPSLALFWAKENMLTEDIQ